MRPTIRAVGLTCAALISLGVAGGTAVASPRSVPARQNARVAGSCSFGAYHATSTVLTATRATTLTHDRVFHQATGPSRPVTVAVPRKATSTAAVMMSTGVSVPAANLILR